MLISNLVAAIEDDNHTQNSDARIVLVNWMLRVVIPPVPTDPLCLRERVRAAEALDNLALSFENLQAKTY